MTRSTSSLAAAFLAIAGCAPTGPVIRESGVTSAQSAAAACASAGGAFKPVGRLGTLQCVVPYADAGKRCTSGDQCAGDCRAADTATIAREQPIAGTCQPTSDRFGCHTRIEGGQALPTVCVD